MLTPQPPLPEPAIQAAARLLAQGRPAAAAERLAALVAEAPTYAAAHVLRATALEAAGLVDEAIVSWGRAAALVPRSPLVHRERERLLATRLADESSEMPPPEPASLPDAGYLAAEDDFPEVSPLETPSGESFAPHLPETPAVPSDGDGAPTSAEAHEAPLADAAEPPSADRSEDDVEASEAGLVWPVPDEPEPTPPAERASFEAEPFEAAGFEPDWGEPDPFAGAMGEERDIEGEVVPILPPEEADPPPVVPDDDPADPFGWQVVDEDDALPPLHAEATSPDAPAPPHAPPSIADELDALIAQLEVAPRIRPDPEYAGPEVALDTGDVDEMASETLAKIYAAQQRYVEAAIVYEKLAAQRPAEADEMLRRAAELRQRG